MKKLVLLVGMIICFWVLTLNSNALTTSGSISKEETWSSTVHLTGDVTVTA